jgi:hypothetical protein
MMGLKDVLKIRVVNRDTAECADRRTREQKSEHPCRTADAEIVSKSTEIRDGSVGIEK